MSINKDFKVSNKTKNFKFNTEPSKILQKQLTGEREVKSLDPDASYSSKETYNIYNNNKAFNDLQRVSPFADDVKRQSSGQSTQQNAKTPKKLGRPPKAKDSKLDVSVSLTFTKSDYEQLKTQHLEYCKHIKHDISFTNYLRGKMLSK